MSVEKSEHLSGLLKKRGVPHTVLNAKQHADEAKIVAMAGHKGAVTVATNMAGRGTDIMLGGSVEFLADARAAQAGPGPGRRERRGVRSRLAGHARADQGAGRQRARRGQATLGGLYVVGTERHESRRIDNQLRGRSGRQGDPGESRFYLSLQDELMRLFKSDWVDRVLTVLKVPDDVPIENKRVTGAIANAQGQIESQNFESRKNVLKYDDVMDRQRQVIYGERREVLEGADLEAADPRLHRRRHRGLRHRRHRGLRRGVGPRGAVDRAQAALPGLAGPPDSSRTRPAAATNLTREVLIEELKKDAHAAYDRREAEIGEEIMRELERRVVLSVLDRKWREHLYEMDYLREGIYLRAYSQRDPLVEYQREGFDMFAAMMDGIKEESVGFLFNLEVEVEDEDDDEDDELVIDPADRPRGRHRADAPGDPVGLREAAAPAAARWPADPGQGPRPAQAAAASSPTPPRSEDGDAEVRAARPPARRRVRRHRPQRRCPLRLRQEVQEVPRRPRRSHRPHGPRAASTTARPSSTAELSSYRWSSTARERAISRALAHRPAVPPSSGTAAQANSRAVHCRRPSRLSKRAAMARNRSP